MNMRSMKSDFRENIEERERSSSPFDSKNRDLKKIIQAKEKEIDGLKRNVAHLTQENAELQKNLHRAIEKIKVKIIQLK